MEKRLMHLFRIITTGSSILFILLFFAAIFQESRPEWKKHQSAYKQSIISMADNDQQLESAKRFKINIQQQILEELDRVDRCASCHTGMQDSRFTREKIPNQTHPGALLRDHAVDEFGCTICHGGQGRAVDRKNAHARSETAKWPHPLLAMEHIQSSCGQCHLSIFSPFDSLQGTDVFQSGQVIFSGEGCLGCHKARGVGGSVGPDLTEQGEKTKHEYNFSNVAGEHSVSNWLFEHFKDPEMVSPGSDMLALGLNDAELHALVTFTMGMNKPDIPFAYFSTETLMEFKGLRRQLAGKTAFAMICSACHGRDGEGKSYETFETGVASIGNQDFLSVASRDLLEFTLKNGRGRRQMAAWTPRFSGLKEGEIQGIVTFLKDRRQVRSNWDDMDLQRADGSNGKRLYEQICQMCHGENGAAAQVVSISNADFLAVATDEFLYQTIANGRRNTAMPAWGGFTSQEMTDLLAFLRGWRTTSRQGVFDAASGDVKSGEALYHYRCSRCHGTYGEGDSGPALINEDLMRTASDFYLAEMITKGRHNTAMFGWRADVASQDRLSTSQVADIITFLRGRAVLPKEVIYPGSNLGAAKSGEQIYDKQCATCHGPNGKGRKAPALDNQELLNAGTNGYLYATVTLGRHDTAMPSWGRGDKERTSLSIKERHDVVAFLRKWQDIVITNVK